MGAARFAVLVSNALRATPAAGLLRCSNRPPDGLHRVARRGGALVGRHVDPWRMVDAMQPSSFVGDDVGRAAAGSPVEAVLESACCLAPLLGARGWMSAVRAHDEWP